MPDKEYLREIAKEIDKRLPDHHGFILLTFPFGDDPTARCSYVAKADRQDAIRVMKEFIIKAGAGEDWMRHLP